MTDIVPHPKVDEYEKRVGERFQQYGGNGGGNGMWQQSVESRLGELRQDIRDLRSDMNKDFRWTWGGMAGGVLLVLGVLAKGFGWI